MLSSEIRENVLDAIKLDLIGPSHNSEQKYLQEILSVNPSAYYLTGFLVPHGSKIRVDIEEDESSVSPDDTDDNTESGGDEANALIKRFPSSIGLSFLLKKNTKGFEVTCRWGEYKPEETKEGILWQRTTFEKKVKVTLADKPNFKLDVVPNEVELVINQKVLNLSSESYNLIENGTKSLSVFLVNKKQGLDKDRPDPWFMFQAEMEIENNDGFCPRPNLRALESDDNDDRIADLQFANVHEYATGHGVAALFNTQEVTCKKIATSWMPAHEVDGVQVPHIANLELSMEKLSKFSDFNSAKTALAPLVTEYKKWIDVQTTLIPKGIKKREETGNHLVQKYKYALKRIEDGIALLSDAKVFESFKIANLAMAMAARKKRSDDPKWRTFQLAFVLMNLKGIVSPSDSERETVDLLYFPTGGGKTEAYLGVVAFTLVYRRLIDPSINSAGVSVLMRYTLRLLTLDQLERATTLICALEKVRREQKSQWNLGDWPYEIGLWVGQAATPNKFGAVGDSNQWSARAMLSAFQNDRGKSPVPLEGCPWCNEPLHQRDSFKFDDQRHPNELRVICVNRDCDFRASGFGKLPLIVVDEEIYRKLPCFIISTVDKLASMPWEERIGNLFGNVDKYHSTLGFYSSTENHAGTQRLNGKLKPLDLIIQDELHLISGPLGTMVGLYETAVDELSSRIVDGKKIKAKIIASTATVRHAQKQVRSLYGRSNVDIFPVPGITSKDSFFSKVVPSTKENAGRLYVGIAAQGRSTKNLLSKTYLSSMSASQKQLDITGNKDIVDPYLTAVGYFNSLRELGGARRIIEDEVNSRLKNYSSRKRVNETVSDILADRSIKFEPVELTSRESTDRVATAKHRLAKPYGDNDFVDVAIATNMISVGLDITRLGLMLVFGQPKTTSEYIQASSRVGRGKTPGLVVALYNIHRHRDRSLYEKFVPYHQSYYRDVETTSVTPFSTKALDKGLAATYLSIVRHLIAGMKREADATQIVAKKTELNNIVSKILLDRLVASGSTTQASNQSLQGRLTALLDDWEKIKNYADSQNGSLTYTGEKLSLIHQYLDPELVNLPNDYLKFRANRSMREVEPSVNIRVRGMNDQELED